jgi:MFS family permease
VLGPLAHLISAAGVACHPSYSLVLFLIAIGAFGIGALDGSWSSWAGGLEQASTISGILHGAFSIGAAAGPALIGALLAADEGRWYQWYYILVSDDVPCCLLTQAHCCCVGRSVVRRASLALGCVPFRNGRQVPARSPR